MLVKGDDVLVAEYISLIDEWVLYGCARTCSLTLNTELIETSVSGSQGWETSEPGKHSFEGSLEGLVNLQDVNLISLADLRLRQIERRKLRLRIQRTAIDGVTVYAEEADFFITSSSDEGALNQMNSFTITIRGTGALTQTFTPAEIVSSVKRFQYTGLAGETSFTNVIDVATGNTITLANKKCLGVYVDGIGFSKMITSGTPTDKQFKFVSSTGQITVPIPVDAGIEVYGYYRN